MDAKLTIQGLPADVASECASGVRRVIYGVLGSVFLVLGVIGVILPGLPTTPFLLLTTYFYARSFPSFNRALLRNPILGPILQNWYEHRGVTRRIKWIAVLMVLSAITMLLVVTTLPWPLLAVVLLAACTGLIVIWALPVVKVA